MCIGIPAKVVAIKDKTAEVVVGKVKREIGLDLLSDVKVGDYIISHAGYAIQVLDEKEALETLELIGDLADALS